MIEGHGCNSYCSDEEHCDLVYSADHRNEKLLRYSLAWHYENRYAVRVTRLQVATEAPDMATIPAGLLRLVAGTVSDGARRWLVWWREE